MRSPFVLPTFTDCLLHGRDMLTAAHPCLDLTFPPYCKRHPTAPDGHLLQIISPTPTAPFRTVQTKKIWMVSSLRFAPKLPTQKRTKQTLQSYSTITTRCGLILKGKSLPASCSHQSPRFHAKSTQRLILRTQSANQGEALEPTTVKVPLSLDSSTSHIAGLMDKS